MLQCCKTNQPCQLTCAGCLRQCWACPGSKKLGDRGFEPMGMGHQGTAGQNGQVQVIPVKGVGSAGMGAVLAMPTCHEPVVNLMLNSVLSTFNN